MKRAIRRRLHAGDRRNVAEEYQVIAPGSGRLRAALAAALRGSAGRRLLRRGDRAGHDRPAARPARGRWPWTSTRGPTRRCRGLAQAQADRARSGHHHGRQCLGHQRRRLPRMLLGIRSGREAARAQRRARGWLGMASAGVPPRIMGIGPVPSTRKLMERLRVQDRATSTSSN